MTRGGRITLRGAVWGGGMVGHLLKCAPGGATLHASSTTALLTVPGLPPGRCALRPRCALHPQLHTIREPALL